MNTPAAVPDVGERILLVEDEDSIADAVAWTLTASGFEVDVFRDGESALKATPTDYDLLVLDVMLPKVSGLEVCRRFRARSAVPILMLTARTGELDRVLGLEAGADDYVTKPFSMLELVSRVRAILRRRELDLRETTLEQRQVGPISIDLESQSVLVDGRPVELTPAEFRLLVHLAGRPERAVSRRELAARVNSRTGLTGERACDVHVKNIRRKIERDPARPQHLVTVRGVGYMLRAV